MDDTENVESELNRRNLATLREQAWRSFNAGDFDRAADVFVELATLGRLKERELRALVEILIDRGDPEAAASIIESTIDHRYGVDAVRLAAELFELRATVGERIARRQAALLVLEAAAATNDVAAWSVLFESDRLRRVEESFETERDLLDALEQEALAPEETGLPTAATIRIEEVGHANASDADTARDAERLLHAFGDTTAAYRVERSRRTAKARSRGRAGVDRPPPEPSLAGLKVAIVGGYPALRALIRRDLERAKVADVREIPSSKEGSRVGRDVQATLTGVDVAILLVRQMGHSTSDQIKRSAEKLNVPVVLVESSGTNGVRQALERFLSE